MQPTHTKRDHGILESLQKAVPLMRKMAARYAEDFEDLYQVAAEVALSYYEKAQQASNPGGYLHRAIRNTILGYVGATDPEAGRKQTLADHYLIVSLDAPLAYDATSTLQDITTTPEHSSSGNRDFSRLYALIDALPDIYRTVICMRFGLCGYGVHRPLEVARILGIPPDTERIRFRKAKAMLKQYTELLELAESQA